jgi:LmbE family N-acetylglucosaminyl deacetylase
MLGLMAARPKRESAAGLARWLGVAGGSEQLSGKAVVLSPHLDDGVFSLGAAIAHAARDGGQVTVATVLAGDPDSDLPAGHWDAASGFGTAGEAAQARRREDEEACTAVGATPVWLDFSDHQYPRGGDDDQVWRALEPQLASADTVLTPGFPLLHEDHAWLRELVERRLSADRRLVRYVEQPYAAAWQGEEPSGKWAPAAANTRDRFAKLRACRSYRSQVELFERSSPVLFRLVRYEAARGGERIQWR